MCVSPPNGDEYILTESDYTKEYLLEYSIFFCTKN